MPNGLLIVDKPSDMTSHDVVAKLRSFYKYKKIGHTGTLDPMASGMLVIVLGKATKLSNYIINHHKEYIAHCTLGITTDTMDKEGNVQTSQAVNCTMSQLKALLRNFLGEQLQTPPMYSAKKVKGKKLYELARQGVEIERPKQQISVYELELLSHEFPQFSMRVSCSKGTYIRSLVHDIGQKLGCGAHLSALRRTKVGEFSIEQAISLDALKAHENPIDLLLPMQKALTGLPQLELDEQSAILVQHGRCVSIPSQSKTFISDMDVGATIALLHAGQLLALATVQNTDSSQAHNFASFQLHPFKVFAAVQ